MKQNLLVEYNFKELTPLVKKVLEAGRTPFIWGPPGIGKSTLGKTVAEELGAQLFVLDAPLLEPTEYAIAVPEKETKTVDLYIAGFIPTEGPAVVLVEDLPHAKTYQMVPLMQLILDRRISNKKIAENVWFIITGNREEDFAYVNSIPSPLLNRVVHFDMKADIEEWTVWAKKNKLDERIIQFINANPQYFVKPPEEGVRAWPTPRSWHMLSDIIKNIDDKEIYPFVLATVGEIAGVFTSWLKYLRGINIEEVIEKGKLPAEVERSQIFTIVQAVAYKTEAGNIKKVAAFWKNLPGEYKMLLLKELIRYKEDKIDTSLLEKFISTEPEAVKFIEGLL